MEDKINIIEENLSKLEEGNLNEEEVKECFTKIKDVLKGILDDNKLHPLHLVPMSKFDDWMDRINKMIEKYE